MADQPPSTLPHYDYRDDEISLYELWNTLVRRRLIIGIVFVLCVVAATGFALSRTAVYPMDMVLEVGQVSSQASLSRDGDSDNPDRIEGPPGLVDRLNEVIIPRVEIALRADALSTASDDVLGEALASLPTPTAEVLSAEAGLVRLVGTVPNAAADSLERVMRAVADEVIALHDQRLADRDEALERQLAESREELERVIQSSQALTDAMRSARDATTEDDPGVNALNRQLAATLSSIVGAIISRDASADVAGIRATISQLEGMVGSHEPTEIVRAPDLSDDPEGQSATTLIGLGAVLGLMLGVFAAFGREFLANAAAQEAG